MLFPKAEAGSICCACAGSPTLLVVGTESRGEGQMEREAGPAKVGSGDKDLRKEGI